MLRKTIAGLLLLLSMANLSTDAAAAQSSTSVAAGRTITAGVDGANFNPQALIACHVHYAFHHRTQRGSSRRVWKVRGAVRSPKGRGRPRPARQAGTRWVSRAGESIPSSRLLPIASLAKEGRAIGLLDGLGGERPPPRRHGLNGLGQAV